jgi:acyl-CoA synthetase (NDP forming)
VATRENEIIGVGRYDRSDDPDNAEVAFLVEDAHQGRGIGTQLLQHLTAYARTHGITAFKAFVLADNHAMLRVFRHSGYTLRRDLAEGVYTVEFPTAYSEEAKAADDRHEQSAVAASLMPIFYPHSIAVVGASRNPASIGGQLFQNLLKGNFTGPLYPVNPSAAVVNSVKAYPSILDIPDPVELAFIVVPGPLVIISAGFAEVGEEGRRLEAELLEVVRTSGMRMIGPNCMGVVNTDPKVGMDGQFGPVYPPAGNVAMSSQSGALGIAILDYAKELNIGISTFVSMGNKADISGNDLLLYWEDDPATDVILLYLESFGNPRRFARIARRVGHSKPVVAVKSGRSAAGARAASSHTGSLASLDVAVDALFHQTGVIRTETLKELFDVTSLLANQPIPQGRRVAVLTNAGGPGILAADAIETRGLELPEFSAELQAGLREHLSAEASTTNPVDMIASAGPDEFRACLGLLMESDEVDSIIVIYIPISGDVAAMEEAADAIAETGMSYGGRKTLLSVFMRSEGAPTQMHRADVHIPTYPFPEPAARALAAAVEYGEWRARPEGEYLRFDDVDTTLASETVLAALAGMDEDGGWLDPPDVEAVLRAYGIGPARSGVATDEDGAWALAEEIGGRVVLKVLSPSALHKSDVGGVALDLNGEEAVRKAFRQVTSVVDDAEGVLVQEYVAGGHEVIIGMTEDPTFGPLVAFGLGGVFVELVGDVAFRIHPLTDLDADEMIAEVKSARLLEGYRGADPGDVPAVKETLLRLSALIEQVPEIVEMDLNPVKVLPPGEGVRIVDARIRVRPMSGPWTPTRKDVPAVASRPQ